MPSIAIKRLSASDLTFFEEIFNTRRNSNQKALNLNRDVFIDEIYPGLAGVRMTTEGAIGVQLSILGPGLAPEYRVPRSIGRTPGAKNWRLNGAAVPDPQNEPARFTNLVAGDVAILEFTGQPVPESVRMILLCQAAPEDAQLHAALQPKVQNPSMATIGQRELMALVDVLQVDPNHPVRLLLMDRALEDAALGGVEGSVRLARLPRLTAAQLLQAKARAADIGAAGEGLVNAHLVSEVERGALTSFEWTSSVNAIAPYDFGCDCPNTGNRMIDVKSTSGEHDRRIHVSSAELQVMGGSTHYDIYRVSEVTEVDGKLRIARDVGPFAQNILNSVAQLPQGVSIDGVSIDPAQLQFDDVIDVSLPDEIDD
jgi:hypothetical protein